MRWLIKRVMMNHPRIYKYFKIAKDIDGLERVKILWEQKAKEKQKGGILQWCESPVVLDHHIQRFYLDNLPSLSFQKNFNWLKCIRDCFISKPLPNALSLGCGDGCLERDAITLNICKRIDAYDVSPGAVKVAQELAEAHKLSDLIRYNVRDLNTISLEENKCHGVFISHALHHVTNIEHLLQEVYKTLKEGGLFILNEFVGPSQFQWTDIQLQIANELLEVLPDELKKDLIYGGVKREIIRPSIEFMNIHDPSEAIRSSEIIPCIEKKFEIVKRIDFGGTILHLLLGNITGNFHNTSNEMGGNILRLLCYFEYLLVKNNILQSDFTLLICRPKKDEAFKKMV